MGKVILVGAGPGAPDLITVRGERAIRSADAVVYDALAPAELLEVASVSSERINVGKRGHDVPTRTQQETVELIIDRAREGKSVVRLKGGDPFVFGRGGEEASACVEAGIPFEVIPGISAVIGVPAYAGIPVTDRRYAASFAVVTGHKDPTKASAETRWDLLGQAVDTLVILMGMQNLELIVDRILASGRSPRTPAAVIMNGSLPDQSTLIAPLGELVTRVRDEGLKSPATVVIGAMEVIAEVAFDLREKRLRVDLCGGESIHGSVRHVCPQVALVVVDLHHRADVDLIAEWKQDRLVLVIMN